MNSFLMKAILAMDSYNRGYNPRIKFSDTADATGIHIGNAVIYKNSSILENPDGSRKDVAAGFYGIAYDYAGETVVSYRGTDENITWGSTTGSDILYGYGVGAGSPEGNQAALAFKFYQSVADEVGLML